MKINLSIKAKHNILRTLFAVALFLAYLICSWLLKWVNPLVMHLVFTALIMYFYMLYCFAKERYGIPKQKSTYSGRYKC